MADQPVERNVTREGKIVQVKRSKVKGASADFVKREVVIKLVIALDESSLAARDDFAFWAFDETPIALTLRPVRSQAELPGMTLRPVRSQAELPGMTLGTDDFGHKVMVEVAKEINKDPSMSAKVVDRVTGEIDEDGDEDS